MAKVLEYPVTILFADVLLAAASFLPSRRGDSRADDTFDSSTSRAKIGGRSSGFLPAPGPLASSDPESTGPTRRSASTHRADTRPSHASSADHRDVARASTPRARSVSPATAVGHRARARATRRIGGIRRASPNILARGSRRRAARGETTLADVAGVDAMMWRADVRAGSLPGGCRTSAAGACSRGPKCLRKFILPSKVHSFDISRDSARGISLKSIAALDRWMTTNCVSGGWRRVSNDAQLLVIHSSSAFVDITQRRRLDVRYVFSFDAHRSLPRVVPASGASSSLARGDADINGSLTRGGAGVNRRPSPVFSIIRGGLTAPSPSRRARPSPCFPNPSRRCRAPAPASCG